MRNEINDDLENIDKRLKFNTNMGTIIGTAGTGAGLTINYHKVSGDFFFFHGKISSWATLLHVKDEKIKR